ncbi:RP-L6e [Lepeophtheirus salmonis]|uniref:RP-L6e n=1 Tax=Lepeophtheirus salmonis TaxID=72036 RepID=A0A7R8H201_LEPSM|nr:RP-L6e [Lepeophtheirus salmonis]CAF2804478.1 RP-L6e [Lepeophtheirus salmonis]
MPKNKNVGKPRSYKLAPGVTTPIEVEASKHVFVEKKVGGTKNGGTRMLHVKKLKNDFPTMERLVHRITNKPKKLSCRVCPSLTPGTIPVILEGIHKGKITVILKEFSSGIFCISGPFKRNNFLIRKINQRYLLAI